MSELQSSNQSRRTVLIAMATVIPSLALAACAPVRPKEIITGITIPEVMKFYPELENLPVKQQGEIHTNQSTTRYYNFTDANFDANKARIVYENLESLPGNNLQLIYKPTKDIQMTIVPAAIIAGFFERVVFLVPPEAKLPKWTGNTLSSGATTNKFKKENNNDPIVSMVRLDNKNGCDVPQGHLLSTCEQMLNKVFMVKACQGTIRADFRIDYANNQINIAPANLAQEITCNTFGSAFESLASGVPPEKITAWLPTFLIGPSGSNQKFPMLNLSTFTLNRFKNLASPISLKK